MSGDEPLVTLDPAQTTAFFDDADWFKVIRVAALYGVIPILGPVVLVGWGQELFRRGVREPNRLVPVDFERHLSAGQASAPAILGWPVLLLAGDAVRGMCFWGLETVLRVADGSLSPELLVHLSDLLYGANELISVVISLLWVPWVLLLPELIRRVYEGALFPWRDPGPSWLAVEANPQGYLKVAGACGVLLVVAFVVSGMFGWLTLLLFPLFLAVLSHLSAQWQRMVAQRRAPGTV